MMPETMVVQSTNPTTIQNPTLTDNQLVVPTKPPNAPLKMTCIKWADCACDATGRVCKCEDQCKCGSVPVETYKDAIANRCGITDCSCGTACKCGNSCECGKVKRTHDEWIELLKDELCVPSEQVENN